MRGTITEQNPERYRTERAQVVYSPNLRRINLSFNQWLETSPVLTWSTGGQDNDAHAETFHAVAPTGIEGADDVRIAFPSVGGVDAPEFVALWWILMLSLSSLVRYEPSLWTSAIDADLSKLAVPLEQVCDFAETFVPTILLMMLTSQE